MASTHIIGRSLAICAIVVGLAGIASTASAQTGQVKGKVVDAENKPVDGATVNLSQADNNTKFSLKTNKKGEYMQIGLPPGNYVIMVEKGALKQSRNVHIGLDMAEANFELKSGSGDGAALSKEDAAKVEARRAAVKAAFAEGAALSNAGKFDEAVVKFNEVIKEVPNCTECYINIGQVQASKKDYAASELAYKKAIELDPNSADAYNGLATIYNDQKKFTEAQAMSAEAGKRATGGAAGGGSAEIRYNQGVIAWNANDFPKAQEHFAAAVAANPNHAESHFMLGRVDLNLGKLPEAAKEFEIYVKMAPTGPNAKEAQTNFDMLKSYIK
ncbi:MAG: tetratricopeptide repeat protein [Acidobacteriota bacterium]